MTKAEFCLSFTSFFADPNEKSQKGIESDFDLRSGLLSVLKKVTWDVKGIMLNSGEVIPLPAESRAVTVILQGIAVEKISEWAKSQGIHFEDLVSETRGYPDTTLTGGPLGNKLIALDIKSARYEGKNRKGDKVSKMTLGTYDGYFLHPNKKSLQGGKRCYNDFNEHWVGGFIYSWDPSLETSKMVKIEEVIVGQKWQVASRVSGSGDTANIGGLDYLERLRNLQHEFSNEDEFERYWRQYALNHPRKRTKAGD